MKVAFAILSLSLAPVWGTWAQEAQDLRQDRPYSFSGACSSKGLWTTQAMQTADSIRSFTNQLKDDPRCQGLGKSMQAALLELEKRVKPPIAENYSSRLSQLPQEIAASRQFILEGGPFREKVLKQMAKSMVELTAMSASHPKTSGGVWNEGMANFLGSGLAVAEGGPAVAATAAALQNLGRRFSASSAEGLNLFNQVIDQLPAMNECLTGEGVASGQVLAASVKLLTTFAVSNQDATGAGLATAISKLSDAMRKMKFTKVLRTLNQADFISSMSCLVEMTSENYCTTRDSQLLYDEMMKEMKVRPKEQELKRLGTSHMLAGYYVMTQNIPMITDWIQRIQIGVVPRLPTDATFQNKIFDDVNSLFKTIKTLQGSFSMYLQALKAIPELKGRQNAVRKIISDLAGMLAPQSVFGSDGSQYNFFTNTSSARELPFILMGIPIPDAVLGKGTAIQTPNEWLEGNYMTHPAFADPEQLVKTVQENVNKVTAAAEKNAINYYNQYFIVDKISLVNESLLGTNYSVKESLKLTYDYIGQVAERIRQSGGDASIIASIRETRVGIRNVLETYRELENLSKSFAGRTDADLTEAERQQIAEANVKVITTIYDEFQTLLGKSGWFANRVIKFVYADYLLMLKTKKDFSQEMNDLFYATGLAIFDRMLSAAQENPAKIRNDLSMALTLNKMNLEAVELLMKDYFAATTADLKAVAKNSSKDVTTRTTHTNLSTFDRAYKDQLVEIPGEGTSKNLRVAKGIWHGVIQSTLNFLNFIPGTDSLAKEKYVARNERFAVDDEFGSSRRLFEQFCIQSLAFTDVRTFYQLCRNVVLDSPFARTFLGDLPEAERKELSTGYRTKLVEHRDQPALNASKRICAFRDYNRKNLVMYLTNAQVR